MCDTKYIKAYTAKEWRHYFHPRRNVFVSTRKKYEKKCRHRAAVLGLRCDIVPLHIKFQFIILTEDQTAAPFAQKENRTSHTLSEGKDQRPQRLLEGCRAFPL